MMVFENEGHAFLIELVTTELGLQGRFFQSWEKKFSLYDWLGKRGRFFTGKKKIRRIKKIFVALC